MLKLLLLYFLYSKLTIEIDNNSTLPWGLMIMKALLLFNEGGEQPNVGQKKPLGKAEVDCQVLEHQLGRAFAQNRRLSCLLQSRREKRIDYDQNVSGVYSVVDPVREMREFTVNSVTKLFF